MHSTHWLRLVASGIVAAVCAQSVVARPAVAQRAAQSRSMRPWVFVGITPEYAYATGEFRENVNHGWGVGSHLMIADRTGIVALRVDAHFVNYGAENKRVCFSNTVGCRVTLDLRTTNNIFTASIGPQFMAPIGQVRVYANGGVGFASFQTQSTLEGSDNAQRPFARSTNARDNTFSLQGGAGLYIPVRRGPQPVSIDLGARFMGNGRATYLTEGGITDQPDGSIELTPRRSDTDFVLFHIGAVVGVR